MELRPHSVKILTHECHAYLSAQEESRAQGQFHVHFPDDKTLTFVAGTQSVRYFAVCQDKSLQIHCSFNITFN